MARHGMQSEVRPSWYPLHCGRRCTELVTEELGQRLSLCWRPQEQPSHHHHHQHQHLPISSASPASMVIDTAINMRFGTAVTAQHHHAIIFCVYPCIELHRLLSRITPSPKQGSPATPDHHPRGFREDFPQFLLRPVPPLPRLQRKDRVETQPPEEPDGEEESQQFPPIFFAPKHAVRSVGEGAT